MKLIPWFLFLVLLASMASALEVNHMPYVSVFATNASGSHEANVDGSNVTQNFTIQPPVGETWFISEMMVEIEDAKNFDADAYGNNIVLTNGIIITQNHQGETHNLTSPLEPIKTNLDWSDYTFDLKIHAFGTGSSNDFLNMRWEFLETGTYLKLNGTLNESIVIQIQDDLTGLTSHDFLFQGFKWDPTNHIQSSEVTTMDYTGGISLTLFLLGIIITLLIFANRKYTKSTITQNIIQRGMYAVALYFMSMASVLMKEISEKAGLDTGYFLFSLMWLFGFLGGLMLIYMVAGAIFDAIEQTKKNRS